MTASIVIPGVFCDVEGTLLKHGVIQDEIVEKLKQFENEGKRIQIWTGGSVLEYGIDIFNKGITWDLCSKYDYKGKTVEIAIDDMPEKRFKSIYNISAKKYIRV